MADNTRGSFFTQKWQRKTKQGYCMDKTSLAHTKPRLDNAMTEKKDFIFISCIFCISKIEKNTCLKKKTNEKLKKYYKRKKRFNLSP